jgi:hypothetical protein
MGAPDPDCKDCFGSGKVRKPGSATNWVDCKCTK